MATSAFESDATNKVSSTNDAMCTVSSAAAVYGVYRRDPKTLLCGTPAIKDISHRSISVILDLKLYIS